MDKTYDPHAIEQRWYQTWEENGYFAPANEGTGSPPPESRNGGERGVVRGQLRAALRSAATAEARLSGYRSISSS